MLKYLKSFLVAPTNEKVLKKKETKTVNIVKYHYELKINWYTTFTKFTTKIKHDTSEEKLNTDDIYYKYIDLYNKLSMQYRLIDYLYRTQTGMFSDNFKSGKFHIDSIQIVEGVELDNGKIIYDSPIVERQYDMSIQVNKNKTWTII